MKKALIVNPFGIGDALFSMTLIETLKKHSPELRFGFLCNERTEALVSMNASVEKHFVFNRDRLRSLQKKSFFDAADYVFTLLKDVRRERYDAVFDVSLGREYPFFAALAGIPRRIGLDYRKRGLFLTKRIPLDAYEGMHVVDFQLKLTEAAGFPAVETYSLKVPLRVSEAVRNEAALFLAASGITPQDKILGIAPGGGKTWGENARYKQWEPERFAEAVNRIRRQAGAPAKVLLIGDRDETAVLRHAAVHLEAPVAVAMGKPLETVCALLKRCEALLCNDGGLLHLANTLGVPTVSLYGPVDAAVYGPYPNGTLAEVLTADVPCRPCYRKFRFPACGHDRRCLTEIPVEKAVAAVRRILSAGASI